MFDPHMWREYLSLSKDVRAQLMAFLQNVLSLLGRNVYLQGRGHGRVDETADDCGDFLLDGGIITVGMTEVLHSKAKREKEEWKVTWEQFCVPTVPQMFAIIEEFLYRDRKTRASFFFFPYSNCTSSISYIIFDLLLELDSQIIDIGSDVQ